MSRPITLVLMVGTGCTDRMKSLALSITLTCSTDMLNKANAFDSHEAFEWIANTDDGSQAKHRRGVK